MTPDTAALSIIFQDDDLMVIDKPPGLVVTPSDTQTDDTLADILHKEYSIDIERGGVVHRLDKDTSGLILVAKNQTSFDALQAQFKERSVKKEYQALVHGELKVAGVVEGAIARNPKAREKFIVLDDEGRPAVTHYEPMKCLVMSEERISQIFPDYSKIQLRKLNTNHYSLFTLVRCKPLTGRTHQIRVHLKYLGFPIVGDDKYGGRKMIRLDHRWCKRQFLHAAKIEFSHPKSGELMSFESELADDLKAALEVLT